MNRNYAYPYEEAERSLNLGLRNVKFSTEYKQKYSLKIMT